VWKLLVDLAGTNFGMASDERQDELVVGKLERIRRVE
jgi:hypothetical protein